VDRQLLHCTSSGYKTTFIKIDCVGTLRLNRKSIPKVVKEKKLRKVKIIAQHSGPMPVLKCCDKKITMMSTYGDEVRKVKTKQEEEKENLVSILDCSQNIVKILRRVGWYTPLIMTGSNSDDRIY
jgi:hypothetical protein